jgi:hypothetical protein
MEHSVPHAGDGTASSPCIGALECSQHGMLQVAAAEQSGSARKVRSKPMSAATGTLLFRRFAAPLGTLPLILDMMVLLQPRRRAGRHVIA